MRSGAIVFLSFWFARVALAVVLPAPLEVRFLDSHIGFASVGGAGPEEKLKVLGEIKVTHFWLTEQRTAKDPAPSFTLKTDIEGSQAQSAKLPKVVDGKITVAADMMAYGQLTFRNLEILGQYGLLRRADFGLTPEGDVYLESIAISDTTVLSQQEVSLILRFEAKTKTNMINADFARLVLSREGGEKIRQAVKKSGREMGAEKLMYVPFETFRAAIIADRVPPAPAPLPNPAPSDPS